MTMTAEQAADWIRPELVKVIAVKQQRLGSRMRAYEALGSKLGRSPTWIRKVLGRAPDVTVGLHDALNIRAAYVRLCLHIAAGNDAIEAENDKIRRELDVALQRDRAPPVASPEETRAPTRAAPAQRARGAAAPAPVPSAAAPLGVVAAAGGDLTDPSERAADDAAVSR